VLPFNQLSGTLPASIGDLGPALHTLCVHKKALFCAFSFLVIARALTTHALAHAQ
jgi:hypothetical protein